jgi:hypothetical protein
VDLRQAHNGLSNLVTRTSVACPVVEAAMFFDPRQRRVFIHRDPVDLRQSHNGLSNVSA